MSAAVEGNNMRKRIIPPPQESTRYAAEEWLHLEHIAEIEVTSEDAEHPIEAALRPHQGNGWRAAEPGVQHLRLLFDTPQQVRRIHLHFIERATERTQEFALRYSVDNGGSFQEIVRQQWNFSPGGATSEVEDYHVALSGVTTIELMLIPDISGGNAYASLTALRLSA
jgi:hypothetical protein